MFTIKILKTFVFRTMICLFTFSILGCAMFKSGKEANKPKEIGQIEQQDYTVRSLQDDLLTFASNFEAYVRSATDEIQSKTDSGEMKKRALLWKLRLVPMVHEIASRTKPQVDYVALAYLTRTMKRYLTVGEGKNTFGEHQSIAVKTASELDQMVIDIGEKFLNSDQMQKLEKNVQIYAEKNPIRGSEFSLEMARKSIQKIDRVNEFRWITDISLAPFGALSGVSAMPAAIRDLSRTIWVTSHIVKHLPRIARWQTELLLYDIENRDAVKEIVKGVSTMDETSRKTGERLELSGKTLIHYAFMRAIGLIILIILLLLGYRMISHFFLTPNPSES